MLDLFNIAKPQNCDIQIFYGGKTGANQSGNNLHKSWMKPRGVSFIYMMLIGSGGYGNGTDGGGSGAVTVWFGNANNVPDQLVVIAAYSSNNGGNNNASTVGSRQASTTGNQTPTALLTASSSTSATGALAMTANAFAASGFFQSVAGANGGTGTLSPSSTTFLSGGADGAGIVQANYGYGGTIGNGYFQLQPIIVGVGGTNQAAPYEAGIGCGNGQASAPGGPGLVLIASW